MAHCYPEIAAAAEGCRFSDCSHIDELVSSFGGDTQQLQDYLITEILSQQPQKVRDICCGLKQSLIRRRFRSASDLRSHVEAEDWS